METTDLLCFIRFKDGTYFGVCYEDTLPPSVDPGGPIGYTNRAKATQKAHEISGVVIIKEVGEMMEICGESEWVHVDDIKGKWVIQPSKGG